MTGAKSFRMNFRQALGFFTVGAVFALIPRYAPGWCESTGLDGSSTRLIWLQIMSLVLMSLGLAHFARRTLVGLDSLLEYTTPQPAPATVVLRTARPAPVRPTLAVPQLSPIDVAFKGGLLDQRRAA
jgi:hypothetical protein